MLIDLIIGVGFMDYGIYGTSECKRENKTIEVGMQWPNYRSKKWSL